MHLQVFKWFRFLSLSPVVLMTLFCRAKRPDFCATYRMLLMFVSLTYLQVIRGTGSQWLNLGRTINGNQAQNAFRNCFNIIFFSEFCTSIRKVQLEFIIYCSITREHVCWWSRDRLSHMRDWRRGGKEENIIFSKIFTLNDLKSLAAHVHYFWNRFSSVVIYMFHLLCVRLRNPCLACWSIKSH